MGNSQRVDGGSTGIPPRYTLDQPMATHEVTNQPPLLVDYDLLSADPLLLSAVGRAIPEITTELVEFGRHLHNRGDVSGGS